MKAFCIFYGTKYDYSTVIDLTREFKKSGVSLRCVHIKDFTKIKEHWHKLRFFDESFTGKDDIIVIDIDQTVVGDISDMINYPVKDNELITYKNWWDKNPNCPINGGWYKFKSGSLQYVWDKFNSNIDYYQNYYFNNSIVHYRYYGEQNFVYDTVIENGGKVTTMPEKWISKYMMDEYKDDIKIIHSLGIKKDDRN